MVEFNNLNNYKPIIDFSFTITIKNQGILFIINIIKYTKTAISIDITVFLAPTVGLEPTTLRLTAACSTD